MIIWFYATLLFIVSVIKWASRLRHLPLVNPWSIFSLYPPFLFMGVKVESYSEDYRRIHVSLPLRWYSKNIHGTMFGGWITALADPIPALMCEKILEHVEVWTKSNYVEFIKPARGKVHLKIEIKDEELVEIRRRLEQEGRTTHIFEITFTDGHSNPIAVAKNEVFFKKREKRSLHT